ncbi:hypothetical protein ACFU99_13025 [Streptomyces sp. NPDC057654]|uniref:hypothetical protein n=1 Tax=Streptomyces sp. NPDC057654 TaxID=3346196 RepID=UPI0036774988
MSDQCITVRGIDSFKRQKGWGMRKSTMGRAGVSLAAVAVLVGVTGCQGDSDKGDKADKAASTQKADTDGQGPRQGADKRTAVQAITAAYKKTSAAKSAKVVMTQSMPAAMKGGGDTKVSGVMGWNPTIMDVNVGDNATGSGAGQAGKTHMIWVDNVMYVEGKPEDLGGKKWAKVDLMAAAKESGAGAQALKQMTAGLEDMNQDPAQQLAILLSAPNIEYVGSEDVGGRRAEHYKGALPVETALKSNKNVEALTPQQREKLIANVKKTGIENYDYDAWVNSDDYPVKMDIRMKTPRGAIRLTADYSDYGAKAAVQVPPADETADLIKVFKEMQDQQKGH